MSSSLRFLRLVGSSLVLGACLLALSTCASLGGGREEAARPNVLFLMVDDMGWGDLSCYGSKAIQTPHIDSLARDGMRFTDAYSGCTVCAPARSTLMDGKHMGHTSVRINTGGAPLRAADTTLAEMMRDAGYTVGGFGKWGLGDLGTEGAAEHHGFDTFYGYYHQIHAHYYLPDYLIRDGAKEMLPGNEGFYDEFPHGKYSGAFPRLDPRTGRERQFASDLIFQETLDFIRAHADDDDPFFCYAPWTPPHGEYLMPDDDPAWLKYADRAGWPTKARVVAAYDTMLDRQVGEVLALLDELGIADDTIVFFCSDNGGDDDFDGVLDSCGPLRGHKRSMYEGGIRVPLLVRWPGHIPAGFETRHPTYFPDVMPTLAALAGVRPPRDIDGVSILPVLRQRGHAPHSAYLYWEWDRYDWGKRELAPDGRMQAVRAGNWKVVRLRPSAPAELYDVSVDPGEETDLAALFPKVVERLVGYMDEAHQPMRPQAEPVAPEGRSFR